MFAEPSSVEELKAAIRYSQKEKLEILILGAASNVLISDSGFDGLVIRLGSKFASITERAETGNGRTIFAESGAMLASLGYKAVQNGLVGAEFACGIPGSVGGAVYMNAGAYGGEMKDIVTSVDYLDENLNICSISGEDAEFGYRHSIFMEHPKWVIIGCEITLKSGDREASMALVNELKAKRIKSQPVDVPSAGSTFKRPTGYFAGKLIEDSNLKGFKLDDSGAQVSPKHAGFVVNNEGRADSADILRLINYVSDTVYQESGVRLEPEVRLIGFSEKE